VRIWRRKANKKVDIQRLFEQHHISKRSVKMADQHPSVQHWQPEPGDIVTAAYKTGNYIGRLTQIRPDRGKGVVQILAVLRHPVQGDLHQPGQADVPLFHERKALAYG
jgi:hypothetical protein